MARASRTRPKAAKRGPGRPRGEGPSSRDAILAAARQEFAERGYAATTMRDVVERAGVTKPALYHHFGNKAGLYKAATGEAIDAVVRNLDAAVAPATGVVAKLEATIDVGIDFMRSEPAIARLIEGMPGEIQRHAELADLAQEANKLPEFFARLCEDGELAAPRHHVARMLQGIFYGSLRVGASSLDSDDYAGAAEALRLLIRGELAPLPKTVS